MGAIRLFLALVVAIDHLRSILLVPAGIQGIPEYLKLGMNAGYAVMFFYMISGFLISTGLAEKYEPTAAGTVAFYRGRFVRIFSLYWPMIGVIFLAFNGLAAAFLMLPLADQITSVIILGMDWRIAFADYPNEHWDASPVFLHPAWTLGAELTFYLVAPFLLRSRKAMLTVFVLSAAIRFGLVKLFGYDNRWTYQFLPSTFLFFLMGHLAREIALRWSSLKEPRVAFSLLAVSAASLCIGGYSKWDSLRFWISAICFALALPGIFLATKRSAPLLVIGDLSYPVYLVHGVVIAKISDYAVLDKLPRSGALIIFLYLAALMAAAAAAHWLLEKPAAFTMQSCLRSISLLVKKLMLRAPRTFPSS